MRRKITETTDGKHIGHVFDDEKKLTLPSWGEFLPEKIQDLGGGLIRYSTVHYVILTKKL
jgi:hypothetical protein